MRLSTAFPAWKDIWVTPQDATLGAYARLNVKILLADGLYPVLFEGVLAKRPGDTVCRIRINDIVAPWLRPQLRALADDEGYYRDPPPGVSAPGFFAYFYVLFSDPEGTVTSDSVSVPVFADWSRDRAPGANAGNQAYLRMAPIDGVADPRQYILISTLTGQSLTFGEVSLTKVGLIATEPVTWYMRAALADASGSLGLLHPVLSGGEVLEPDGETLGGTVTGVEGYRVEATCARYCLYYANALGGMDSFLIRGRVVETDRINRTDYTRLGGTDLLAGNVEQRGRDVLETSVRKHLEMHTGWLTDAQAARMWHLAESPAVWVHDLEEDVIRPAVLTGTAHEYKSHRGNGNRLVSYQIDLDLAVDGERG